MTGPFDGSIWDDPKDPARDWHDDWQLQHDRALDEMDKNLQMAARVLELFGEDTTEEAA